MAEFKWSLTALTALLSLAICSAHKLTTDVTWPAVAVPPTPRPIINAPTPIPAGPTPAGLVPAPSGRVPVISGPVPAGPTPSGPAPPVPAGPAPSGPVPPVPAGLTPSGPASPVPSGHVRVWHVSSGPVPVPAMEASTSGYAVKPPPKMNSIQPTAPPMTSHVDDNELGAGWGCGGGGIPGCGGFGCPPAAPKNPYYCQPANCGGTPGYGGNGNGNGYGNGNGNGNGFTIYLGDHFPSSGSDDEHKS